jgi:predicted deacylase
VTCSFDLDQPGWSSGFLRVPASTNTSAWSSVRIPICSIRRDDGPVVLMTGAVHGDEFIGPLVLPELCQWLQTNLGAGQVIVIPCASMPAAALGARLWPSGENLNRCAPGDPNGTVAEQLTHFVIEELIARADVFVDLHAGGHTLEFLPMSHMHLVDDREQRRRMFDAMVAFNSPHHMLYMNTSGSGLIVSEAEARGKTVVSTEWGGGDRVRHEQVVSCTAGLINLLRTVGVVDGAPATRADMGLDEAMLLSCLRPDAYVEAGRTGVCRPAVDLGEVVEADQPLVEIIDLSSPWDPPHPVRSPTDGIVCALRTLAPVEDGDVVVVVGETVTASDILAGGPAR